MSFSRTALTKIPSSIIPILRPYLLPHIASSPVAVQRERYGLLREATQRDGFECADAQEGGRQFAPLLNPHTSTIPKRNSSSPRPRPNDTRVSDINSSDRSGPSTKTISDVRYPEIVTPQDLRLGLAKLKSRLVRHAKSTLAGKDGDHHSRLVELIEVILRAKTSAYDPRKRTAAKSERQRKSKLFGLIIKAFLAHPLPRNMDIAFGFIQRASAEGCDVSPGVLNLYLRTVLDATGDKESTASDQSAPSTQNIELGVPQVSSDGQSLPSKKRDGPLDLVAAALPFLPQYPDIPLLTLILSIIVTHSRPSPSEIKHMITSCMAIRGEGLGEMDKWDWSLWDVYLSSYLAVGDVEGAWLEMVEFGRVVEKERSLRISKRRTHHRHQPVWSEGERDAITRPFISLLHHWAMKPFKPRDPSVPTPVAERVRRRAQRYRLEQSELPRLLTGVIVHLLSSETVTVDEDIPTGAAFARNCAFDDVGLNVVDRAKMPSMVFMNVLMNAYRIVGDFEAVQRVWELVSGTNLDGHAITRNAGHAGTDQVEIPPTSRGPVSGQVGSGTAKKGLSPDSYTYTALFRTLKARLVPPSRQLLSTILADPEHVTPTCLNAALSALVNTSAWRSSTPGETDSDTNFAWSSRDLPAVLLLLQQFQYFTGPSASGSAPIPNKRTIDIVSAGLIQLWRSGFINVFDQTAAELVQHGRLVPSKRYASSVSVGLGLAKISRTEFTGIYPFGTIDQLANLSLREWDMVSRELHLTRIELERKRMPAGYRPSNGSNKGSAQDIKATTELKGDQVVLPVGQPLARLIRGLATQSLPDRKQSQSTETGHPIFHPPSVPTSNNFETVKTLFPALIRLMERAIVSAERKRLGSTHQVGDGKDLTDKQILGGAMRAVRGEVMRK